MWYMRNLMRDLRVTPNLRELRFSHPMFPELTLRVGNHIDVMTDAAGVVRRLGDALA